MFWIAVVLSLIMLAEAIVSLGRVLAFRKFFARKLNEPSTPVFTRVALIAPCKGVDFQLRENIQSWLDQDYPNYKIFFVVDSSEDPAVRVLHEFTNAELMIAGHAIDSGQKVHNLSFVTSQIPQEYEAFVFVDSDCRLKPDWLRNLVNQLIQDPENAASGYRWFTNGRNFASTLRAVWNSAVLTLYQENGKNNFAWGGATAIFRRVFAQCRVIEFWKGSISDDYGLTNALKHSNRRVNFVPGGMAFTDDSITLPEFLKWSFRQLLITRIYYPRLWTAALLFHVAWFFWIITGIFFPFYFWPPFLLVQLIQSFKADLRWRCIREVVELPNNQRVWFWVLGPLTGLCNLYLTLSTIVTRTVTWRNVKYRLLGPNRLEKIQDR